MTPSAESAPRARPAATVSPGPRTRVLAGPRGAAGLVLATLLGIGFALRSHGIGAIALWYDEVALWSYALTGQVPTFSEPPLMPRLVYAVMWWLRSADPLVVHAVPTVLGTLTIPFAFLMGKRLGGSTAVGLFAAGLTAISPMAIHYSREGRPYALFILLSAAVYLAFDRALRRDRWPAWLAYGLLLCACGLSHLLTLEVMMVVGLAALLATLRPARPEDALRARVARLMRFACVTAVAGVVGTWWAVDRAGFSRGLEGVYPRGPLAFLRVALINLGPGPIQPCASPLPRPLPEILALAFLVLFVLGLRALRQKGRHDLVRLLALAVAVPLLVKYLTLGARKADWDWARWTTHGLLPYLVVAGIGVDAIRRRLPGPRPLVLGLFILLAGVLPASVDPFQRDEYAEHKAVAAYLAENAGRLEGVVVLPVDWRQAGGADDRVTDIYYQLKRDSLPLYHFVQGRIDTVALVPSRGDITLLPRGSGRPAPGLRPGTYAILSRRPLRDCAELGVSAAIKARGSSVVLKGLTLCDLDFRR
jgi:Dolichyl-phosphate-mannose-protein mannosyltransferase